MKPQPETDAQSGRSLERLVLRVEEERRRCIDRMAIYRQKGHKQQYHFTMGQHDAFGGMLIWLAEAQNEKS